MQSIPIKKNLKLAQFETWTQKLLFRENGIVVDLTGWTIYFIVKSKMSDPDASAVITKTVTTHTDAENGETAVELTSSDTDLSTGSYYYQLEFLSDESSRKIVMEGRLTIEKNLKDS